MLEFLTYLFLSLLLEREKDFCRVWNSAPTVCICIPTSPSGFEIIVEAPKINTTWYLYNT